MSVHAYLFLATALASTACSLVKAGTVRWEVQLDEDVVALALVQTFYSVNRDSLAEGLVHDSPTVASTKTVIKPEQMDFVRRLNGLTVKSPKPWHKEWSDNWWCNECLLAIDAHDYLAFAIKDGARRAYGDFQQGQQTKGYDGGELDLVGSDEWALGAKICAANGWLSYPGDSLSNLSDFTYMADLATRSCSNFFEEIPDLETNTYTNKTYSAIQAYSDPAPTRKNLRIEEARRCVKFPPLALGCDIAFCKYNFCSLPGGQVGQGQQCRDSWLDEATVMPHIEDVYFAYSS